MFWDLRSANSDFLNLLAESSLFHSFIFTSVLGVGRGNKLLKDVYQAHLSRVSILYSYLLYGKVAGLICVVKVMNSTSRETMGVIQHQ